MNTIRKHVPCSSRGVKQERELRISLAITHGVLVLEKVERDIFFFIGMNFILLQPEAPARRPDLFLRFVELRKMTPKTHNFPVLRQLFKVFNKYKWTSNFLLSSISTLLYHHTTSLLSQRDRSRAPARPGRPALPPHPDCVGWQGIDDDGEECHERRPR
jgi:hypothetical protein